ncbi:MAG: SUMF1/EgtB/PvdO family nonheme iron enzyme, partial [Pseudomonadota bacterium]
MADSDPTPTAKSSKTIRLILVIATCFAVGCVLGWALFYSPAERPIEAAPTLALAPSNCLDSFGGEVRVEGATFTMGRADAYPDEGPAKQVTVDGFWIDTHEVTNAQFTAFVDATGYVTAAERISPFAEVDGAADDLKQPGSVTFSPPTEDHPQAGWWVYTAGANWRQPEGPGSNLDGREHHPVVQVNFEDALAYASWAGRDLPTEAEYELAALARAPGGGPVNSRIPADRFGNITANTWQGFFPNENTAADGYTASAPVGCFPANDYGAYDLIGNVWGLSQSLSIRVGNNEIHAIELFV